MCEIKLIKSKTMFPIINEILKEGAHVRITVTGMSMYPFLRDCIDSVLISLTCFSNIKVGDIVLIKSYEDQYILHRVYKKGKGEFSMMGDALLVKEEPIYPHQLLAKVIGVWRGDKYICCENILWRILWFAWRGLAPFRKLYIKGYYFIQRHTR